MIADKQANDVAYDIVERTIAQRVNDLHGNRLFEVENHGREILWERYMQYLPENKRQHYNCNCCRRFIERYGYIVRITESFKAVSVLWETDGIPEMFRDAFAAMERYVKNQKIVRPYVNSDAVWGVPTNVGAISGITWTHLSGHCRLPCSLEKNVATEVGVIKENYGLLKRTLHEFPIAMVEQVEAILMAEAITKSEAYLAPVQWFKSMFRGSNEDTQTHDNRCWIAAVTTPKGFLHIKNSNAGVLIEDLMNGTSFEVAKNRWLTRLDPLKYKRQVATSTGNIKLAEKLIVDGGYAESLKRRQARQEEIQCFWLPAAEPIPEKAVSGTGVFDHLKKDIKAVTPVATVKIPISWPKFLTNVLPTMKTLELLVPMMGSFRGMTNAVNPEAPNMLKWSNTVASYLHHPTGVATDWNLKPGFWTKVLGLSKHPAHWQDTMPQVNERVFLMLEGADDKRDKKGLAIFPENLRSEFHSIRATIEAHSNAGNLETVTNPAAGYSFDKGQPGTLCLLRVNNTMIYEIERWE